MTVVNTIKALYVNNVATKFSYEKSHLIISSVDSVEGCVDIQIEGHPDKLTFNADELKRAINNCLNS